MERGKGNTCWESMINAWKEVKVIHVGNLFLIWKV